MGSSLAFIWIFQLWSLAAVGLGKFSLYAPFVPCFPTINGAKRAGQA